MPRVLLVVGLLLAGVLIVAALQPAPVLEEAPIVPPLVVESPEVTPSEEAGSDEAHAPAIVSVAVSRWFDDVMRLHTEVGRGADDDPQRAHQQRAGWLERQAPLVALDGRLTPGSPGDEIKLRYARTFLLPNIHEWLALSNFPYTEEELEAIKIEGTMLLADMGTVLVTGEGDASALLVRWDEFHAKFGRPVTTLKTERMLDEAATVRVTIKLDLHRLARLAGPGGRTTSPATK